MFNDSKAPSLQLTLPIFAADTTQIYPRFTQGLPMQSNLSESMSQCESLEPARRRPAPSAPFTVHGPQDS